MEFLQLAEGVGHFKQKNALCIEFVYAKKNTLCVTIYIQKAGHLVSHFIRKKQCTLRYVLYETIYVFGLQY